MRRATSSPASAMPATASSERAGPTDPVAHDQPRDRNLPVHPNIALVQQLYAAFMQMDRDALMAAMTPDITFDAPGSSPASGSWRGREDVIAHLTEGDPLVEDYGLEVVDMLASDERVAVIAITSGVRAGRQIRNEFVQVLRIEDGRVAEIRNYPFDQAAVDAAFA